MLLRRVITIAVLVIFILILPTRFTNWLRDSISHALSPLASQLVHENRTLGNAWDNFQQIPQLRSERQQLQQQVLALQQEVAKDEQVKQENETLRQELGITGVTQTIPKVLARVILQGSNRLDQTLTVDVGSKQGIAVNQPAIYNGTLIGRVAEVHDNTAVIRLVTSTRSFVQAQISQNQQKGLLVGTGTSVKLTDVIQGSTIPTDGIVETSGLGGNLPQGILIGSLGSAISKPNDLSQSFQVGLPQDPASLDSFFILHITTGS